MNMLLYFAYELAAVDNVYNFLIQIVALFFCVLAYGQPREFAVCPLNTNDEINSWLKHFEVTSPLICQSVLVSKDPVGEISNLSEMD